MRALGLNDAKEVDTPGVSKSSEAFVEDNGCEHLDPDQSTLYRACAARCNFLGLDRPDIQYAAKEVSRGMANPTVSNMIDLKRVGRYLKRFPRAAFMYLHQLPLEVIRVYSDSNWAGCVKTRKSIQGGAAMLGGCCIKA